MYSLTANAAVIIANATNITSELIILHSTTVRKQDSKPIIPILFLFCGILYIISVNLIYNSSVFHMDKKLISFLRSIARKSIFVSLPINILSISAYI